MKPLREQVTELLLAHEGKLERKGWGQPPTLRGIWADRWGRLRIGSNLLTREWQHSRWPYRGMSALATAFHTGLCPMLTPADWRGWVFTYEAWGLFGGGEGDGLTPEEVYAAADNRLIHQHPLRHEGRFVMAQDLDGISCTVLRVRGKAPRVESPDPESLVLQALTELTNATRMLREAAG